MLSFFDSLNDLAAAVRDSLRERPRRLALRGMIAAEAVAALLDAAQQAGCPAVFDKRDMPQKGLAVAIEAATTSNADLIVVADQSGEALHGILMDYVDQADIDIFCMKTPWHFQNRPLLFVSIPKSGTHLALSLLEQFGYRFLHDSLRQDNLRKGFANDILRDDELGKLLVRRFGPDAPVLEGGTLHPISAPSYHLPYRQPFEALSEMGARQTRLTQLPIIFSYRHPLGVLLSESWAYRDSANHILGPYYATFPDTEAVCEDLARGIGLTSLAERLGSYLAWMRLPNVIPVSFEELVGDAGGGDADLQRRLVWSLQLKLQIPGDPERYAAAVFNPQSRTFRRGRLDAFKDELADDRAFLDRHPEIKQLCADFGYDADWSPSEPETPLHRALRHRPLPGDAAPVMVARPGAAVVWKADQWHATLPAAFETICTHGIFSSAKDSALTKLRMTARDLPTLRAAIQAPQARARYESFRYLGTFWHFGIARDDERYYAFLQNGFHRHWQGPCRGRIVSHEKAGRLIALIYDEIRDICRDAPWVVFDTEDTNVVLYKSSAYLVPRRLGPVEIDADERVHHSEAIRIDEQTFAQYFFAHEAASHAARLTEAPLFENCEAQQGGNAPTDPAVRLCGSYEEMLRDLKVAAR